MGIGKGESLFAQEFKDREIRCQKLKQSFIPSDSE